MKNIYSILSLSLILITVSVFGQSRIYTPNLRAPENMEIGQMPDVVLDWDAVTGISPVIEYELQLADNAEFIDAFTFEKTSLTAIQMTDLTFGGKYYWRVRAYDGNDVSDWSEAWYFSVIWNIRMKQPTDKTEVYANPTITWYELSGIEGYEMQYDTIYDWNAEESGVTDNIYATHYVASDDIWAVGAGGLVLHNDGFGWTTVDIGVTENLNAITFVDAFNGYAVGDAGTVAYYNGANWTTVDIGATSILRDVDFYDMDNGVVVGENGVVFVYSAGTWTEEVTGDDNSLYGVSMLNPTNIWACGLGKIVVNYDGVSWEANVVGTKDHLAIAMVNENNGWVVNKGGKINRWDGVAWFDENTYTSNDLFDVDFVGMTGYAVGKSGTLLEFNGGWSIVTTGLSENLNGVSAATDDAIIVGDAGIMIRKANNGFNSPYLKTLSIPADTAEWSLSNLLFGQTFYYRMRAFHNEDTSQWSGVKSMTTIAAPVLISPTTGSEEDLLVEFTWEVYDGTTNYVFELDEDASFSTPRAFAPEYDSLLVNDLVFGQEYFWRLAAQHADDISDWSEVWTFTTVNNIYLETPEDNAVEVKLCPLFTWVGVAGASEYELWVDTDETFGNPTKYNGAEPSYQCQSTMTPNTVYYWKVRGKSGPLVSEWSDTWSFRTEPGIGIDEIVEESLTIYPNPGNGMFNVNITSNTNNNYHLRVIDITGKMIYETDIECSVGNNSIPVSIDNIQSGSYSLIISNKAQIISKQLIVK